MLNQFLGLRMKTRIFIVLIAVMLISGIAAATIFAFGNGENEQEQDVVAEVDFNEVNEVINEVVPENVIVAEAPEEQKVEEKVTYKGKEVVVKKAQVAPKNSAEDAQKGKTGGETISAEEAVEQFENPGQSVGIDISVWQGKINWAKVKESGIEFAIIRAGFRGQTGGVIFEDETFRYNVVNAVKNGIQIGIYFYSTALNEMEALEEAAWVVSVIKAYPITYPVIYDFEDFGRFRCANVDGKTATTNAKAFLGYIANAGYTPMMYANASDIQHRFIKSELASYKYWLAHYATKTDYRGSFQMWQYTSQGTVLGISRKC